MTYFKNWRVQIITHFKNWGVKIKTKIWRRWNKTAYAALLALLFGLAILQSDFCPDLYFIHWAPLEDTSCHYEEPIEPLPRADAIDFKPKSKSIFFHETSCKGDLNSRQACAVESAARAHPDWQINVLFAAPVTLYALKTGTLSALSNIPNIKLSRVHIVKYAKGTPLESWLAGGALNRTRWRFIHSSDVLRYLSLYKFGGMCLDLDVVVAKSFESLGKNWATRETDTSMGAAALALSSDQMGMQLADAAIENLKSRFRGDDRRNNGAGVITRVLDKRCNGVSLVKMSHATCDGFHVYGPTLFYPISRQKADIYFKEGDIDDKIPYVFHFWHEKTIWQSVEKYSPYNKLARKYCPEVYKVYRYFGM